MANRVRKTLINPHPPCTLDHSAKNKIRGTHYKAICEINAKGFRSRFATDSERERRESTRPGEDVSLNVESRAVWSKIQTLADQRCAGPAEIPEKEAWSETRCQLRKLFGCKNGLVFSH